MPSFSRKNPLNRQAELLAQKVERTLSSITARLTDPEPPFMVRLNEEQKLQRYIDDRNSGALVKMRESNGGPYPDDQVDEYAAWGEHALSKAMPAMILKDHQDPSNQTPFNVDEGALHALGLHPVQQQETASPEP